MTAFLFNDDFRRELMASPHHHGEVTFLESVLAPGMVVIEGGANRGVTAVAVARAVGATGHVHAFEPIPEYFEALQANLAGNGVENATAHRLALSDRTGCLSFHKNGEGSGIVSSEGAEAIEVDAITLVRFVEDYGVSRVDFVNLDCEGSELSVLRSAKAWLEAGHPPIFCEVHRPYLEALGQSVAGIVEFLAGIGYVVDPIQAEDLASPSTFETCSHIHAHVPTGRGA
jgi:FkbM family methyltransferase